MDGALGFQIRIESDRIVSILILYDLPQFLIEGRLVIESCGQTEGQILVEVRDKSQRNARTEDKFLIETPIAPAHASRQAKQSLLDAELEIVLQIGRETRAFQFALRVKVGIEVHLLPRMRQRVACRIALFPFGNPVVDALELHLRPPFQGIVPKARAPIMPYVHDCGMQSVACMFAITGYRHGTASGIQSRVRISPIAQPVFTHDVVPLFLLAIKGGGLQSQRHIILGFIRKGQCAKESLELIPLVAIGEIDHEVLHVVQRPRRCLAAMGHEMVLVRGEISQERGFPFGGDGVGHVGLQIQETRVVFSIRIHRAEQGTPAFIPESRHLGELPDRTPHVGRASHQASRYGTLECLGFLIGNIQHGAHLIAIARLESSGRELHFLRQVRVHEAQPLLLPRTDQQRAKHLDTIHIDDILVITSPAHGVLRAQLVVRRDTGKRHHQALDASPRRVGQEAHLIGLHRLHRVRLFSDGGDRDFAQVDSRIVHLHVQPHIRLQDRHNPFRLIISEARVEKGDGIARGHVERVISFLVRHRAVQRVLHHDVHQLQRIAIRIAHISRHLHPLLRLDGKNHEKGQA